MMTKPLDCYGPQMNGRGKIETRERLPEIPSLPKRPSKKKLCGAKFVVLVEANNSGYENVVARYRDGKLL